MNRANIFMIAGWIGLAGLLCFSSFLLESIPEAVSVGGFIIAVLACWVMLFTRKADEYTQGLWTSAASLAFAVLLVLFVGLPFLEGLYDGFQKGLTDGQKENVKDIPSDIAILFAVIAFYVGLFWKKLRGDV